MHCEIKQGLTEDQDTESEVRPPRLHEDQAVWNSDWKYQYKLIMHFTDKQEPNS